MGTVVTGIVDSYAEAHEIVRDLELAGIAGEHVELISGAEDDARAIGTDAQKRGEKQPRRTRHSRKRNTSAADDREVNDDFARAQDLYASPVRQGRAMLVVHATNPRAAEQAAEILKSRGAKAVSRDADSSAQNRPRAPERIPGPAVAEEASSEGGPGTTGGYRSDLVGRGQEMDPAGEHDREAEPPSDLRAVRAFSGGAHEAGSVPDTPERARELDFRSHYQRYAVSSGMNYEDYAPAYEFGFRMAKDSRFSGREFDSVESSLRGEFEAENRGKSWARFRDAVRYGWERGRSAGTRDANPALE